MSGRGRIEEYLAGELTEADGYGGNFTGAGCPTCPGPCAGVVGVTAALGGRHDPDAEGPPRRAERVREPLASDPT